MTRNLKTLGLALVATLAIGALVAQGALAAENHQFHADAAKVDSTGQQIGAHELVVGTAGTVKCNAVNGEATHTFTEVSAGTFERDTITVAPHYSECTFGGSPATLNFNHCAYVADSDTTAGNTTGGEPANVEVECAAGSVVEIATTVCTLTIGPQVISDAARFEDDPNNKNSIITKATAHGIVIGNKADKAGCALVPKGAIGKYNGEVTLTCYKDEGSTALEGTERTTPTGLLKHGPETECRIKKGTEK